MPSRRRGEGSPPRDGGVVARAAFATLLPMHTTLVHLPPTPRHKAMAAVVAVLPLAAARVSRLSLENHFSLAVRRDGRGTIEQLATLLNVVFVAYFLRDCRPDDITPYTDAEAALTGVPGARNAASRWRLMLANYTARTCNRHSRCTACLGAHAPLSDCAGTASAHTRRGRRVASSSDHGCPKSHHAV